MCKKQWIFFSSNQGYALTSVLFLLSILTLLALSTLLVQHFQRILTLADIARVKADYACESGIDKTLSEMDSLSQLLSGKSPLTRSYVMPDESEAQVNVFPWGVFLAAVAEGRFRSFKTSETAILADHPGSRFDKALLYMNSSHQLTFTGTSSVVGDILVGEPGVTIGNLHNYTTPIHIPVTGEIHKEKNPELPAFSIPFLDEQLASFDSILSSTGSATATISEPEDSLHLGLIKDCVREVRIRGDYSLTGTLIRSAIPLSIYVSGHASVKRTAKLYGLIELVASSGIEVERGAAIKGAILCSRDSIGVAEGCQLSAQLISPRLNIRGSCVLKYPSVVYSTPLGTRDSAVQSIELADNTRVEGFVALNARQLLPQREPTIMIDEPAKVVGAVYSNSRVTLDGCVIGTVITKDFYFYDSPTSYLGWLRSGRITRNKLPSGFLVPPCFSESVRLSVLEWL